MTGARPRCSTRPRTSSTVPGRRSSPGAGRARSAPVLEASAPQAIASERSPFTADAAVALPGPPWLRALRGAAAERALASPSPTEAEEIWRYSRIGELDLDRYVLAQPGLAAGVPPDAIAAAVAATRAAILTSRIRHAHRRPSGASASSTRSSRRGVSRCRSPATWPRSAR